MAKPDIHPSPGVNGRCTARTGMTGPFEAKERENGVGERHDAE